MGHGATCQSVRWMQCMAGPQAQSRGQPHTLLLCMCESQHTCTHMQGGLHCCTHCTPTGAGCTHSTDLPAPSPQPHHCAQDHSAWGQDTRTHCSAVDSVLGVWVSPPQSCPLGTWRALAPAAQGAEPSLPAGQDVPVTCLLQPAPGTGRNGCGEGECSGMG